VIIKNREYPHSVVLDMATRLVQLFMQKQRRWYTKVLPVKMVLLYGSVARGESLPGDIDLMIINDGSIAPAPVLPYGHMRIHSVFELLCSNLLISYEEWKNILCDMSVDLKVVHETFLTSMQVRQAHARREHDPMFYQNVFADFMRYDEAEQRFVPETITGLERLLGTRLGDLAKLKEPVET